MTKAAAAKRSGGASTFWLQGMMCGALVAFASPFALLFGVLMAPAVAAMLTDREPGRPVGRAVFLAGAAASVAPAWHLWWAGGTMAEALDMLADVSTLAVAWLLGATAWALCQVLPMITMVVWNWREAARARGLLEELKSLREEWGLE